MLFVKPRSIVILNTSHLAKEITHFLHNEIRNLRVRSVILFAKPNFWLFQLWERDSNIIALSNRTTVVLRQPQSERKPVKGRMPTLFMFAVRVQIVEARPFDAFNQTIFRVWRKRCQKHTTGIIGLWRPSIRRLLIHRCRHFLSIWNRICGALVFSFIKGKCELGFDSCRID